MEEALKKVTGASVGSSGRTVTLCLRSHTTHLNGIWNWDMNSAAVYASDVMFFPDNLEGTKGIIHPDDLPKLIAAISLMETKEAPQLDFRIITTYGEVKTVSGKRISIIDHKNDLMEALPGKEPWEAAIEGIAKNKELDFLQIRKELSDFSERLHGTGTWLLNKTTAQAWYSDSFYRIYNLAPQTLNAHANAFNSFLHKEDRDAVLDAFEKAYEEQLPLHIEYRIVLTGGSIRYVQLISKWMYSHKGEQLFLGVLRDVTEERKLLDELLAAQTKTSFHQDVLKLLQQQTTTGYWFINLQTRQASYSDTFYRIYGVKHFTPVSVQSFLHLVHTDDRKRVEAAMNEMFSQRNLPETGFRIVRPDGKLRYLKQSARLFSAANKEELMIGVVQDVTVVQGLEKKIGELNEMVFLSQALHSLKEETSGISTVSWLPNDVMVWSEGFQNLIGAKPGEASEKFLYKSIHADDVKTFNAAKTRAVDGDTIEAIDVRLLTKTGVRNTKISFRLLHEKSILIAVVKDVTRQLVLQKEFAYNQSLADLVADSTKDILIFSNSDNVVMSWNAKAEEKTGISKEQALYTNLFEVLPALQKEDFLQQLKGANEGIAVAAVRSENSYFHKAHDYWLQPLRQEEEIIGVLHIVRDVSKQVELQQQLSERLSFIESLIASSVDRIVALDRFMNYLYWNKKAEAYYGIQREKVIGKNILEIFPSFRNDPGYSEFRKVLKGETVYIPATVSEDTNEYAETYLTPIKNEEGTVTAILWIVHDLKGELQLRQERETATKKIKEQAHYLQRITETTPDMISIMELETRKFTFLNAQTFEANGFNAKQIAEQDDEGNRLIIYPDDRSVLDEYFQKFITASDEDVASAEYRAKNVNDEWGWYLVRGKVFQRNEKGETTHILNAIENITERKKAEEEVFRLKDEVAKKAEDKYRTLFECIDEGVATMELIFDEEGHCTDWLYLEHNPALARLTGITQNIVGKKASDIYQNLEPFWMETFGRIVREGVPERFEYGVAELGNQWFNVYAARVGGSGSRKLVLVYNNITERKRHEERQAYLLKLGDALRSLSDALSIQDTVTREAMAHFNSDRCYYCEIDNNAAIVRRDASRENLPSIVGVYPLRDFTLFTAAINLQKPFIVYDVHITDLVDEPLKQICIGLQIISFIIVPVIKNEKAVGLFCLVQSNPREWKETEVQLAAETAERTWAAVERAKAEETLRSVSKSLEQQVEERIKEVKHSKNLLQSIFDASLHGIMVLQAVKSNHEISDFKILLHNAITQQWNGRNLVGKNYAEEFPAIREEGLFDSLKRVLETGEQLNTEVRYEKGDVTSWFRVTAVKLSEDQIVTTAEDISVSKKGAEEIRKQLTILQHTEAIAQTGSWEYKIDNNRFTWSEGMYRLFGLPGQVPVQPEIYIDFSLEEDRPVAKRIVHLLRKKHKPFEEEMRIKTREGIRLLRIKGTIVNNYKGEPVKIIGVDLDITNIKQAEEQLKESRHWLEETTKSSPDSITVYDLHKKQPVYLNNCLAEWVGISRTDLLNMGIEGRLKLIYEDDRLKLLHFNEKVAEANDGEIITMEYRVRNDEGKIIWLRNRSKPFLRDGDGKVTHILSILQNVTEEVELKEQLKQRTQFAESILDASVDRITVFDRHYRFVGWNKRCEQVHRKTKEEVIGKTIFEMFPGVEKYPEFMNAQEQSLKGEYVHVPMIRDAFTGGYLELFYIPLKNESGETYAVVNIMHDVSDYVITTEALNTMNKKLEAKNAELERKNEEITSFAFVASHDMKEPLRKIHTFSDWLMGMESDWLSQEGKNIMAKINASVKRMEQVLDDILVLTKIHSDTHKEENADLNNVLKQVMEDMSELIEQTSATIHSKKLPMIKANSNQLFYLFKHLISNAIKFQKPGNVPQVTIVPAIVKGTELKINDPAEEYLKLSFTDNGFGLDQRYAKKIFQVFQRLHGKYEFEGTGIGLAICKKIMENHNGTITVESELDKGSIFNCFFPLH